MEGYCIHDLKNYTERHRYLGEVFSRLIGNTDSQCIDFCYIIANAGKNLQMKTCGIGARKEL